MTTNLYNLTEDSMRYVLSYLEINEILILRKVSWNIRYTIDEINPNFNIRSVSIAPDSKKIVLTFVTDRNWTITYRESSMGQLKGCMVTKENYNGGYFLKEGEYMDVAAKDLEIILSNRKSVLEELVIKLDSNKEVNNKIITAISTALESNIQQLKVKKLEMDVTKQAQIFEVFRCINPKKLKIIKLSQPSYLFVSELLETNGACELEQWKQAERLEIENLTIPDIHQNLMHFKSFNVKVNKITPDDLLFLKEKLKKSPTFEEASIRYVSFDDSDRLSELFSGFEYTRGTSKSCIFHFSDTNRYLVFKLATFKSLLFIRNLKESELTDRITKDALFIKE
ncbi:hypothetical protein CAEBREN_22818 [Caenorhabditis brenneri]|uniref:F-box domain-containing protein n=1 Tax=Caenorhabditis brenneri TaxID=135651 RepID=G0NEU5_CAEBE|nr:hypothetical protein CAEBREN_22818 [Caenorhabditis brenneri]